MLPPILVVYCELQTRPGNPFSCTAVKSGPVLFLGMLWLLGAPRVLPRFHSPPAHGCASAMLATRLWAPLTLMPMEFSV